MSAINTTSTLGAISTVYVCWLKTLLLTVIPLRGEADLKTTVAVEGELLPRQISYVDSKKRFNRASRK